VIFSYPLAFDAPVRGGSRRKIATPFGTEKLKWCGYPMWKFFEDMFIRFDRVHESDRRTDGQTDGRTPHDSIGRENGCDYFRIVFFTTEPDGLATTWCKNIAEKFCHVNIGCTNVTDDRQQTELRWRNVRLKLYNVNHDTKANALPITAKDKSLTIWDSRRNSVFYAAWLCL